MQTKVCSKCQRTKAVSEYRRDMSNANGIRSACKECCNKRDKDSRTRRKGEYRRVDSGIGDSILCPEVPLVDLEIELGPAGIAPVTPEEAHKAAPEGFAVKGVSTLYGPDGEIKAQWVKTSREDEDKIRIFEEAVSRIAEPFRDYADPVAPPPVTDDDLLSCSVIGDGHVGLYAWAKETGADFNLEIAEDNLVRAIDYMVHIAPPASEALIINVGDFYHADSTENRTRRGGHILDVDSRWPKVLSVGIRALRRCIDRALEKHPKVSVVCAAGNHDIGSAVMLSQCLQNFYAREPRVFIYDTVGKFHWVRWGQCLLGVTHGDTTTPQSARDAMTVDRAKDWGETQYRHIYQGHVHHSSSRELAGVTVESVGTLAAPDAYATAGGWRSARTLSMDVWSKRFGRVDRHQIGIQQIWAMGGLGKPEAA